MSGNKEEAKKYTLRMIGVFFAYTVLLISVNLTDDRFDLPQWQRVVLSLLPVIPAVIMLFVIVAFVRSMDEVWRRIVTESALIAAGVVSIGTFTLGFIDGVIAIPSEILLWILPAMVAVQGIAMIFVRRRYS